MTKRTGHCLCSAVHFHLTVDPQVTRICWCRDCQHLASNGTVNMLVPTESLTFEGNLAEYTNTAASGNKVTRQFCPHCGTHLFAFSSARPQFRIVRVGNLDDPSSVTPSVNIWSANAPTWACLDQNLENIAKQPLPPQAPFKPLI